MKNELASKSIGELSPRLDSYDPKLLEAIMNLAINNMDDYTADVFDLICILWMSKAKSVNDMITFSLEDVLKMRNLAKSKGDTGYETYQKSQQIEVMERMTAIARIFIKLDNDMSGSDSDERKNFNLYNYKKLFYIDNITVAEDKETKKIVGFYKYDIKPTEEFAKYLLENKKITGFLSLKALQYNPVKHKYHKRLTRYLSWQWKIRSVRKDYDRAFSIGGDKGLLKAIGLKESEQMPIRTRETFEKILDDLVDDGVISGWKYQEIDGNLIGIKGWFDNYWSQLKVIISPPQRIIEYFENLDKFFVNYEKAKELGRNLAENLVEVIDYTPMPLERPRKLIVTPELVSSIRKERGLSITKAAKEIGISHSSLSRYENGKIRHLNVENEEKVRQWILKNV